MEHLLTMQNLCETFKDNTLSNKPKQLFVNHMT